MAPNFTKTAALLCFLLPVWAFSTVESAPSHGAPAPAADCSSLVLTMADCLSFVTNDSTAKKPEGGCCNGLKTVLKTNAECLCEALKNSAQFGVTLNVTKALSLPSACHVSAPSISNCGLSATPGAAPALSPGALPPSSTSGAPAGSIGGNQAAPAPTPGNGGSGSPAPAGLLVLSLLAAASLSLF